MAKNIDKSNMRGVIIDFPKQFEKALELAKDVKVEGKFENIIIAGMGGSAFPSDILISWLSHSNLKVPPIYPHRDYNLPPWIRKKSLIICISYSGNTEEPVSVLKEAIKKKMKVVAITSDGEFEKFSKKHNIPWVKIPSGIEPRSATGYLFAALVKVLINSKIIDDKSKEILEIAKKLKKLNYEKKGKALAKKLKNKIPLVYASNKFKCVARGWKTRFNENSKIPAFYNYFPELNHNEMTGFTQAHKVLCTDQLQTKQNSKFHIIILKDKKSDHPGNLKRMRLFSELIKAEEIDVDFIDIEKGSHLFKILSTILLGDWVSYYLALEYKVDPTPIKMQEEFKKKLK